MPTIKTSDTHNIVDLDTLLSQIRLRGIAVGSPEMQRLHAVFSQAPVLSRNELRHLLIALLAKDNWQRSRIDRIFDQLVPYDDEAIDQNRTGNKNRSAKQLSPHLAGDSAKTDDPEEAEVTESFSWRDLAPKTIFKASLAALMSVIVAIVVLEVLTKPDTPTNPNPIHKPQPTDKKPPRVSDDEEVEEQGLKLVKHIDHWIPHVESRPRDVWAQLIPVLLMLLGSGLGFSWLLYKVLEKSKQEKANRPKLIRERGRFQVAGIGKPADYHLLSGEQRREMRWGIGRYQSEQPLNRLNIPLSVQQSAAAGMPQLAFEHRQHEREVWLWQESDSDNPDLSRLAEEIRHSLQRANISVRLGYFRGVPASVRGEQGEVYWSTRHEYPETEPLVVIFADADYLSQSQHHQPDQADKALRQLSHWPQLCFVDCSQQAGTLQRLLQPHTLECILPQAVPNWLATQGRNRERSTDNCVLESLQQWAMACALPNRVIMEDEIRALHNALGFDCGWQFHAMTRYAKVAGRGFDFRLRRQQLLNELSTSSQHAELIKKAVQFWSVRNQELNEALREKQQLEGAAWEQTRKQKQLERDTALLQLWVEPSAAKTLYDLHAHPRLQKDIRNELSHYRCHGFKVSTVNSDGLPTQITLPFQWEDLEAETQRQLIHSGFGGQADPTAKLTTDNTTRGILAGLAAMILIFFVISVYLLIPKDAQIQLSADSAEPPATMKIPPEQSGQYLAATHKSIGRYAKPDYIKDHQPLDDDQVITVRWERRAVQRAQVILDEARPETSAQHWFLGTVANPKRPNSLEEPWPDLSIAVIFTDNPQDKTIHRLAAKLLDTGSADQVLFGKGNTLQDKHQKLIDQTVLIKSSQWIYIDGPVLKGHKRGSQKRVAKIDLPPQTLLNRLKQSNQTFELTELEGVTQRSGAQSPLLQAQKPPIETLPLANKMTLIKIPQGSFEMGSEKYNDEKPVHKVTINYDFWMSQTEVTFEQYDAYITAIKQQANSPVKTKVPTVPEAPNDAGWGRGTQPVMRVSWDDAQAYIKWFSDTNPQGLQCRLPSEAEWEYAARAGTTTEYTWGDEIGKNNANCDGCGSEWDNKQTAPVASFKPNAFGLYDMHGNVWEWVQDSYHGNYTGAPTNGEAWEGDDDFSRRVVRGGSWGNSPDVLRSAVRGYYSPDVRNFYVGFRIVCSSH